MLDRDLLEKALLIGVVREKNWKVLILNGITVDYFTPINKEMFNYIYEDVCADKYPELPILCYKFNIDDDTLALCLEASNLEDLCKTLKDDYLQEKVRFEVNKLNDYSDELKHNPSKYIDRIGEMYDELKLAGTQSHSVGLLDGIEDVLEIDPNDVISTGFKELDQILVGWKRGEELVSFMARTNQR